MYVAFVGISVNVAKKNRKLCDLGHMLAYSIFKACFKVNYLKTIINEKKLRYTFCFVL